MKTLLKALYAAIVGLIVFTGALMIVQGMRENAQTPDTQAETAVAPALPAILEEEEGSAL